MKKDLLIFPNISSIFVELKQVQIIKLSSEINFMKRDYSSWTFKSTFFTIYRTLVHKFSSRNLIASLARRSCAHRGASFKEDEGTWKGNDDGKVVNNQPQRVMDDRNGLGPQGGYIAKITNDAREGEMEENMGQVNTMIGNLRNMAIDMGSELENQNRQIDRINRKVSNGWMRSTGVRTLHREVTWHGSKERTPERQSASAVCSSTYEYVSRTLIAKTGVSRRDHGTRSENRAFQAWNCYVCYCTLALNPWS